MPKPDTPAQPELIEVRATVNLTGLTRGNVVRVDPSIPYIRMCLARKLLIPV